MERSFDPRPDWPRFCEICVRGYSSPDVRFAVVNGHEVCEFCVQELEDDLRKRK